HSGFTKRRSRNALACPATHPVPTVQKAALGSSLIEMKWRGETTEKSKMSR
ncbi:hypothetical protein ATANTOWER_032880, partial [Ataeniobius toweri]|nr:hypothetical protein [Ataeniobius toweri]